MAILLITHDMGVIAGHADRTMVMYAGKIVEAAATDRLFEDVHHPYTEALLASIPQLDQDKTQRLYAIPGLPPDLSRPLQACRFAPRCQYATEVCRTEEPPLGGDDSGHPYACFHPVDRAVEEIAGAGDLLGEGAEAAPLVEVGAVSVAVAGGPVTNGGLAPQAGNGNNLHRRRARLGPGTLGTGSIGRSLAGLDESHVGGGRRLESARQ